jgi:hypothetical protein
MAGLVDIFRFWTGWFTTAEKTWLVISWLV